MEKLKSFEKEISDTESEEDSDTAESHGEDVSDSLDFTVLYNDLYRRWRSLYV